MRKTKSQTPKISRRFDLLDLSSFSKKRLIMVTGKGGIGKTTVAVALGQWAASQGKETLLIESSARAQIPPVFGKTESNNQRIQLQPGLSHINLDAEGNFREYVTKYLGQKALYDKVLKAQIVQSFINVIPGFSEVMLLGRLFYTCELAPQKPDLVIFDGPASGHFHSLMTTPDAIEATQLGGPLAREMERVRTFLADHEKCASIYVGVPEELVVSEALEFIPKLRQGVASLNQVVVNRSLENLDSISEHQHPGLARKQQQGSLALKQLKDGLSKLNPPIEICQLPDLGFIDEPWAKDFGLQLWEKSFDS